MKRDYVYKDDEKMCFKFFPLPKILFFDERFSHIPCECKLLYSMMLDRTNLSKENNWCDENGKVYIFFSSEEVQSKMSCGRTKALALLKRLDVEFDLIDRKRQGFGKPDIIYVKVLDEIKYDSYEGDEDEFAKGGEIFAPRGEDYAGVGKIFHHLNF